jgi:hypothetical protein
MPFSHRIHRDQRVIVARLWGALTSAQIDEHRRAIRSDPDFDPGLRLIADMRGITTLDFPSHKVREVSTRQILEGGQQRAIVAATPEQYGVARMYSAYASIRDERIEVFRDWASAAEWLGLSGALALDPSTPPAGE